MEKDLLEKDLGPEVHISMKLVGASIRFEANYSGADGKGGVWWEESPKPAIDKLIALLPEYAQPFAKMAEGALLPAA